MVFELTAVSYYNLADVMRKMDLLSLTRFRETTKYNNAMALEHRIKMTVDKRFEVRLDENHLNGGYVYSYIAPQVCCSSFPKTCLFRVEDGICELFAVFKSCSP